MDSFFHILVMAVVVLLGAKIGMCLFNWLVGRDDEVEPWER